MKDEVEEFLRRVAQMRAAAEAQAKGQKPQPAKAQKPPPAPPQPASPARLVPARVETPRPELKPIEAEVVDAELAEQGERVGREVREHMRGTEQIAERTRHLGEEVDQADEKLEAHLHQVFDHQLGRLKASGVAAAGPQAPGAHDLLPGDILRMLRSPQSVRDAIIMAEILRRPEQLP